MQTKVLKITKSTHSESTWSISMRYQSQNLSLFRYPLWHALGSSPKCPILPITQHTFWMKFKEGWKHNLRNVSSMLSVMSSVAYTRLKPYTTIQQQTHLWSVPRKNIKLAHSWAEQGHSNNIKVKGQKVKMILLFTGPNIRLICPENMKHLPNFGFCAMAQTNFLQSRL